MPHSQTKYNAPGAGSDDALARTRREVDDLKGIMVENVEKVLKRGEHLDLLVDRAEDLQFEVRRKGGGGRLSPGSRPSALGVILSLRAYACVAVLRSFCASQCYHDGSINVSPSHVFLLSHRQAQRFERGARKLKRQMWWQDKRWYIVFFIIFVVLLIIILKLAKVF